MAGASSSSGSGSRKYDVFINFRGEDTRRCFVCHLYEALKQKALETYIDSEELRKGENLSELLEAIKGSRLSIVVFSKDYASSTWCLRELVQILECKDLQGQTVVPVFYEVDPSQVRKLEERFAEAFAKHESDPKVDNKEVKSWKSALETAAAISGHHSRNYQDDMSLIQSIVEGVSDIFDKLILNSPSKTDGLIGMDSHMDKIDSLLEPGVDDCRILGIWGMGGIGKTTIARAVYEKYSPQFEHTCFLDKVKESGKEQMFKTLVCTILKIKDQSKLDGCLNLNWMKERLGKKKILLVLDDVDNRDQIDNLLGENPSFGGGSRILITTRDTKLLGRYLIYEPKLLTPEKSRELLCRHAFRTIEYSESYDAILTSAVEYAGGLPLALKVLGALLDNRTVQQWECELKKINKIPMRDIQGVLRASYDGLDDCQKSIFLDIACFFIRKHIDFVTEFHESCDYFPQTGLTVLKERSLITVSEYSGKLEMHDLIQEMGREIVRQESTEDPGERSRLWYQKDVVEVLASDEGSKKVEGIILELSNLNEVWVNKAALAGMKSLRMLQLSTTGWNTDFDQDLVPYFEPYLDPDEDWVFGRSRSKDCTQRVTGSGYLKFSKELRVLVWHGYPLQSLPSDMSTTNLIRIDMSRSKLKQLWKGNKSLQNLAYMDLSYSMDLIMTPDFSDAKKLRTLKLLGCSSLSEVDISALESISFLVLQRCTNLRKFPNISGNMKELRALYLCGSAITEVPSSVNDLPGLETLSMRNCRELRSLPSSIHLKSLKFLSLSGCYKLAEFPEISGEMVRLTDLRLDDTAIEKLPSSIINFTSLKRLSMRGCRSLVCLPEEICNLKYLIDLDLTDCSKMEKLPENFDNLKSLRQTVKAAGSGITQLPIWILRKHSVSFKGCKQITAPFSSWPTLDHQIPRGSVLFSLDLSGCNLLELSDAIAHLSSLQHLKLSGNKNLESLPAAMNRLVHLSSLQVEGCMQLKSIPELSSGVRLIYADDCTSLETVSAPFTRYSCLTFANCLKLKMKPDLFIDTVETTNVHQVDDSSLESRCSMFLPGSDIPEWFSHQSRGSSVTVQLPLNWSLNEFQGFAMCVVSNLQGAPTRHTLKHAECFAATFKTNDGHEDKFESYLRPYLFGTHMSLESDHMFLAYLSSSYLRMETAGKKYTEATFGIVARARETYSRKDITSCGVRLLLGKFSNELGVSNGRVLVWHGYPLQSLPSGISTMNLTKIDMSRSKLKQLWEGTKSLQNLVYMDLSLSKDLIRTPDFSDAKKLQTLDLRGCSSLSEVDISALESISFLVLQRCTNLRKFPNISGNMKELRALYLCGSAITEVPSSVSDLPGLETLSMRNCRELRSLPSSIHLKSLDCLDLSGCSKLAEFPGISGEMVRLTILLLDDTAIEKLPSSIINFSSLKRLSMRGCRSLVCLPDEICNLKYLSVLDLTDCSKMEKLPENFDNLKAAGSGITQLPIRILRMNTVSFEGCKQIKAPFSSWPTLDHQIPGRSVLRDLDLSGCNLLELSDAIAHLSSLQHLKLSGNKNLESLPAAMNRLVHLYRLEVEGCMQLKSIPELSSGVRQIYADDCTSLETVSAPFTRNSCLTFANCLKLQMKPDLFIDTVETTIVNQVDSSSLESRCSMFLPGSDIPDWLSHQSRGSSVTVQLPLDWFPREFQGLAICAISKLQGVQTRRSRTYPKCFATFKANDGQEDKFESYLHPCRYGTGMPFESDHMFLTYLSSSHLRMETAGKKYTEATFTIEQDKGSWMTSCGVQLFMGNRNSFWVIEKQRSKRKRETLEREREDEQMEVQEERGGGLFRRAHMLLHIVEWVAGCTNKRQKHRVTLKPQDQGLRKPISRLKETQL